MFILLVTLIVLLRPLSLSIPARLLRWSAASALIILSMGSFVFSNQVYLKKGLEMQATLSAFSRVISLVEQNPNYKPGETPVAFVGTLENSVLADGLKGFEHVTVLDAASNSFSAITPEDTTWYLWTVLGYPFNLVTGGALDQIAKLPEVQDMPVFPSSESCRFINDTLVIRLSEK